MKVVIIDYGMGNIKSIISALRYLKVDKIIVSNESSVINSADKLILPGVGSFSEAIQNIKKKEINKILEECIINDKKPVLGICLGMQLLGMSSTEDGVNEGLKIINGWVDKFNNSTNKIPHMGFNQVKSASNSKLYCGLEDCSDFYFVHSFKMTSDADINQSMCSYGGEFIASYEQDNIAGVQFHPELSQRNGLKLLNNFLCFF